jgi:cell division protein FtsB
MKRLFFFILLLSLLASFGNEGWVKFYKMRQAVASLESQNRAVAAENEKIRREIENLKDPKYLDHFIRNEIGFVREGESLYEFVEKR